MHDIEPVVIWLFSVSMGMILMIVMTGLASQPCRQAVSQDAYERMPASHMGHRPAGLAVPISLRPWDTPRVVSEREATGPPRAA